jgi:carboxyl-terminal processing protease
METRGNAGYLPSGLMKGPNQAGNLPETEDNDCKSVALTESGRKYKVWEPLLLTVVTVLGMLAGAKFVKADSQVQKPETALTNAHYSGRQVEEIIRFLETKYVGDVSTDELVAKAIQSIMQGLDPHTHYFPPDQMEELEERTSGHYVGIGIEVAFLGDSLVVLYPKEDSPAERAGIRPGDYIIAVNDQKIPDDSLDQEEILALIKGSKGTKVKLTVRPMLSDAIKTIEVTRDEIKVPSVIAGYMVDTAVAYIKLQRFTNSTYREFMDEWERMSTQHGARHLILDLRDNPGGYLKEAVNILSQIIEEEGKLLVYTQGKDEQKVEYKSTGKVFFPVENVTVLINEGSASASEIIAGCIQDQDRGLILGTRSYGKGLVQEQYELSNGGILRMTVAKYYTPSGRLIQKAYDSTSEVDTNIIFKTTLGRPVHAGGGIVPDIMVKDEINWQHPIQKLWMDILSEYAIRYNLVHHQGEILPVEQIDKIQSELPDESTIVAGISALAAKRSKPEEKDSLLKFLADHKGDVMRIAKATLVAYRTGEEGWYIAFNTTDPVVRKAREMVQLDLLMALQQN